MKSVRPNLFRQKTSPTDTAKNAVTRIPVLSAKEKASLVAGNNIMLRESYIFDNTRANRHIEAQTALMMLYQIGADLINKGTAYSTNADISPPSNGRPRRNPAKTEDQQNISDLLMEKYLSLPKHVVANGRHSASNPFPALFVIRVALDHMAPESVYLLYTSLKIHLRNLTIFPNVISFPNGSEFLGDYSILQILHGYITQNQHLYAGILTHLELKAAVDKSDPVIASYSCVADTYMKATVENILGGSILNYDNSNSLRNTWG